MKKLLLVTTLLMLVFALAACGSNTTTATEEPTTVADTIDEMEDEYMETGDAGGEAVADVASTEEQDLLEEGSQLADEEVDEFAMYRVPSGAEKDGFYLKRGDEYYKIGKSVPLWLDNYSCGWTASVGATSVTLYNSYRGEGEGWFPGWMFSFGNVPILTVRPDDEVVLFSESIVPDLDLRPAEVYGYTIPIYEQHGKLYCSHQYGGPTTTYEKYKELEIVDSDGALVEDYRNLVKDQVYTASWFIGTQFYEYSFTADCTVYHAEKEIAYTVGGELARTTEGYATYDFSNVAPGIYRLGMMDASNSLVDFGLIIVE